MRRYEGMKSYTKINKWGDGDFPDYFTLDMQAIQRDLEGSAATKIQWPCPICPKTLGSYNKLLTHKFSVHGKVLRWCKPCGASFLT